MPYTHLGVSRIWHLAHLQAMTLSEPPGDGDETAVGLCEFCELGDLKEAIKYYLAHPEARLSKGEIFHNSLQTHKSEESIASALSYLPHTNSA